MSDNESDYGWGEKEDFTWKWCVASKETIHIDDCVGCELCGGVEP